ncbi:MAG TPA: class F sortase [Candidatus Peribacteraceae bacterium]|nr:class F sortase [Candidatus Peribacteraceae bacterium]
MPVPHVILRLAQLACVVLIFVSVLLAGNMLFPDPNAAPTIADSSNIPVRIRIPRLDIDSPVISVGLDANGQMEVPARAEDVGWFAPGVFPGNSGSSVLAGHFDTVLGTPGVFWNLGALRPADSIFIETSSGHVLQFDVIGMQSYPYDRAPLREIFGASSGRVLNLITCKGTWDGETYDQRVVVSARLNIST